MTDLFKLQTMNALSGKIYDSDIFSFPRPTRERNLNSLRIVKLALFDLDLILVVDIST